MVAALIRSRLHLFTDGFYYPNICKRAEYYSEYPSLSCNSSLIGFLDEKYERVAQGAEQGIWKMSIDEFNQEMEEIREDELYR